MAGEERAAEAKREKKPAREGKRVRTGRKHESLSAKDYYEVQGSELKRKRKSCPRCGEGTWLARHKNRQYCGRCGYTVFEGKNNTVQQEAAATEHVEKKKE